VFAVHADKVVAVSQNLQRFIDKMPY